MNHTRVLSDRYPLSALCDALHCDLNGLKKRCGIDRRQIARYAAQGLPEARADQLAIKAGLHPAEVWPDFGAVECALAGCESWFRPHRPGHVYHDRRCARKAWARTAKGKASLAAAKDRWLETAREYDRKRERDRKRRLRAELREAA